MLQTLWKRRKLAGIVLGSTLLLGVLVCIFIPVKYESTATIEITPQDNNPVETADPNASTPDAVKADIATDTEILQDDSLALQVVKKLGFLDHPPYKPKPGLIDWLEGSPRRQELGKPIEEAPHIRYDVLKRFSKSLKVKPVADTNLIDVTFRDPDPNNAKDGVNALVDAFENDYLTRYDQSATSASFWLAKQLQDLKANVETSEKKLADYERETGLNGADLTQAQNGAGPVVQTRNVTLDRLSALNEKLIDAQTNRIAAEAVYKLVNTQDPEVVLGLGAMGISNGQAAASIGASTLDTLQNLRQQESTLKAQYADMATKYGENNPKLKQVQNELDSVHQSAQHELTNLTLKAKNAYLLAKGNEDALRQQFDQQQGAANKLNDDTVELQVLAQEAFSNRTLYENLFSKLHEADIAVGVKATRISVVNPGRIEAWPAVPNIPIYMAAAFALGLILAVSVACLRENLDETVYTSRDVQLSTPLPLLAEIPKLGTSPGSSLDALSPRAPSLLDRFSVLKTAIIQEGKLRPAKIILVTSAFAGEGKTSVTYNLANSFARQGERVLMIDGDLRKSALHLLANVKNGSGVRELAESNTHFSDSVTRLEGIENLSLLTAGTHPGWPDQIFASAQFHDAMTKACSDYDRIIVDSPPMLLAADAAILSSFADALLLVVRVGQATHADLENMTMALERTGKPILGYVLNGTETNGHKHVFDYSTQS